MVIDTSAVLAVLLNEPTRPALIRATQGKNLVAALSLPWEVGNALIAGLRRRRLTRASVNAAWSSYRQVQVRIAEIDVGSALEIASDLHLHAYDAYVLETARAQGRPLITLDRGLARAAAKLALKLLELGS